MIHRFLLGVRGIQPRPTRPAAGLGLVLAVCALLAGGGCSGPAPPDEGFVPEPGAADLRIKEAPMLRRLVGEGKLPPPEERLPQDPLVVTPVEEPGVYGGTWRRVHRSPELPVLKMVVYYNPIIRWRPDCRGMAPGLASAIENNENATRYTIHVRRGLHWSDGAPFTSEDFRFWWDLCLDDRYHFEPPYWAQSGGEPMQVDTPDPYTIMLRFRQPNYFLPLNMASGFWWAEQYNIPKHYMKQFHPDYSPKYTDFQEFDEKNTVHKNADRPTMAPWMLTEIDPGATRVILERNPYYWVVDDHGRQLPYIDRIDSTLVQTEDAVLLKIMAGEVDCLFREMELMDAALLHRSAERGGYRLLRWETGAGADPCICVNWSHEDPRMRRLLREKRFRWALSHAINRYRINQVVWEGMGVPQQGTVSRQAWHFQSPEGKAIWDEWAAAHAEYSPEKANGYLDELGFTGRDADGFRTWPDSDETLQLVLLTADTGRHNDTAVLVEEMWEDVGIRTVIYTPPGAQATNLRTLGEFDVATNGTAEMDLFTYPDWVFPTRPQYWHPKVGKWYETRGEEGEPPTGPVAELVRIYDECKSEPDLEKRHRLIHQAVRIHIDEGPFYIGTVAQLPALVVAKHNFRNVPPTGVLGPWAIGQPGAWFPEQFFFKPATGGAR